MDYYKPTKQTKFDKEGNCLSACIATLFCIDINDIPEFEGDNWNLKLSRWFCDKFGQYVLPVKLDPAHYEILNGSIMITCINSDNPLVDRHAVITRHGKIIFDPMVGNVDLVIREDHDPIFLVIGNKKRVK